MQNVIAVVVLLLMAGSPVAVRANGLQLPLPSSPQIPKASPASRELPSRTQLWLHTVNEIGSGRGLQDGWAVDNACGVLFTPQVAATIASSGARWVRVNFRLGASKKWTETLTCGVSALTLYDVVVNNARAAGLQVLGLLSNESWPGIQADWQANSAEYQGGNGDNPYLQSFSRDAATVLAGHFARQVGWWEVWNEPNAYTSYSPDAGYTGSTFIYPSNFAWLLRHVYEDTRHAGIQEVKFVTGGVFGHDLPLTSALAGADGLPRRGDPQTPAYYAGNRVLETGLPGPLRHLKSLDASPVSEPVDQLSGAEYLRATYEQGIALAGWEAVRQQYGTYPFDAASQHPYRDQGDETTGERIAAHLAAVRGIVTIYEGTGSATQTWITEVGWATNHVSEAIQATNLRIAFDTFEATEYVGVAFWFQLRDIPPANLFYGLLTPFDPPWTYKMAWAAFRPYRVYLPMITATR
jgi:hypothetical protein